jgi:hypothetical protein
VEVISHYRENRDHRQRTGIAGQLLPAFEKAEHNFCSRVPTVEG